MMSNTSRITATVGSARFDAEGPVALVLDQYTRFLKSVRMARATMEESGPLPLGVWMLRRCFTVDVTTTLPPAQPPAARFVHHFVTRRY